MFKEKKVMKKILGLFAVVFAFMFALVSCNASYSTDGMKNGLKGQGFTVDVYTPAQYDAQQNGAIETSKLDGIKDVIVAYKTINEKEESVVILVFDSIGNASNAMQKTEELSALFNFVSRLGDKGVETALGQYNNVFLAGSAAAKKAAGIK